MASEQEIYEELTAWAEELGPKAYVSAGITGRRGDDFKCHVSVYPDGICGKGEHLHVQGKTLDGTLADAKAKWAEMAEEFAARRLRDMALAIIRLTDELGACTDAALRQDGFDQSEIDKIGMAACERADEIAGKGPFAIEMIGSANQAAE